MKSTAAIAVIALVSLSSGRASASGENVPERLDEVTVTGERPGPEMWKVSKGEHVMWLLGTLDPLPKRMTWKSAKVDAVIASAELILPARRPVHVSAGPFGLIKLYFEWRRTERNPQDRTLQQQVPATLYARFEGVKNRFDARDSKIETLRPMVAARRLYRAAIDDAGLSSDDIVEKSVIKTAKNLRIQVRENPIIVDDPKGLLSELNAIPLDAEIKCLEVTVARLETDITPMRERAAAWAIGDVERLRKLPYPDQKAACWEAVENASRLREFADRIWRQRLAEADDTLTQHRVSLALVPIDSLLTADGVLATFRARGYRVDGP